MLLPAISAALDGFGMLSLAYTGQFGADDQFHDGQAQLRIPLQ